MIAGIFHKGSGLGNQLHRYVATRVLALQKGYDFGMVAPELFKGKDFMNLDMGHNSGANYSIENGTGKVILELPLLTVDNEEVPLWNEWDKQVYDPDINFVEDNTIIDGNFEDERYFIAYLPQIDEWLKVEPELLSEFYNQDRICLIGFRGGEYYAIPELGLPKEYFDRAVKEMLEINPNMHFEVHTDDPLLAAQFFPNYKIVHDVAQNWTAMRVAKYAIIANSSFYVLPRLLNGGLTIAPRYWNRYNTKKWEYPQNYYKQLKYI